MAGRLAFGLAGFVLGVGVTLLFTMGSPDSPRSRREQHDTAALLPTGTREERAGIATGGSDPRQAQPSSATNAGSEAGAIQETAARYLSEINGAASWREAWAIVGRMVAELKPEDARDVMKAIYRDIGDVDKRKQILKPFVFQGGHPYALDILHLAATDPDMDVRARAFGYLQQYAFLDFSEDMAAYDAWRRRFEGSPLADVLAINLGAFVERLRGADDQAYAKAVQMFRADSRTCEAAGVDMAAVLQQAGMVGLLADRLKQAGPAPRSETEEAEEARINQATLDWLLLADPEGRVARPWIEATLAKDAEAFPYPVSSALQALGSIRQPWAFDMLVGTLKRPMTRGMLSGVGAAFAQHGDKRAIPWLIAAIATNETEDKTQALGSTGLARLTGVTPDKSQDAKWWLEWWDRNRDRLPPEVRALDPRALDLR